MQTQSITDAIREKVYFLAKKEEKLVERCKSFTTEKERKGTKKCPILSIK